MAQARRLGLVLWLIAGCTEGPPPGSESEQRVEVEPGTIFRDGMPVVGINNRGLALSAAPLREIVPVEGPLLVEIVVTNVSDSIARFRPIFNFGAFLDAEILDSFGVSLGETASVDPPNQFQLTLWPGESVNATVDLRCSIGGFRMEGLEDTCFGPYDGLSRPGTFEVRMHFTVPCDERGGCDVPLTLEAEPFQVRVVERARR
jgi:hypothetical protein